MDPNSWINNPSVFSPSSPFSRRRQSRSDLYVGGGYENLEGEDDVKTEYMCPFCAEVFDIVELCCHIDEDHPLEVKNGVCPLCTKRVGLDIVGHITTQHSNFFKVQRTRRLRRGGYNSTYLALKREANLQSRLSGSSSFTSSTNIDSDPLLSSFMFNPHSAIESVNKSSTPVTQGTSVTKVSNKEPLKRDIGEAPLSGQDQEKARKCEFVRGLFLSTMLREHL